MEGMQCGSCRDALGALLDSELASDAAGRVREHLAGCEACQAELAALESLGRAVRSLPRAGMPEALKQRLLEEARSTTGRGRAPLARPASRYRWAAGSLAGAALLVVLALVARRAEPPPSPLPAHGDSQAQRAREAEEHAPGADAAGLRGTDSELPAPRARDRIVAKPDDSTRKNGSAGPAHGFAASPPPAGAAPKSPESMPPVVGLAREAPGETMADRPAGATDQLAKTRPDEREQDERVPGRYRTSFDWSDLSAPRFGPLRPEPIEQAGPAQVVLHDGAAAPAAGDEDSATGSVLEELALLPGQGGGSRQEESRDASAGEEAAAPPGPRAEEIHRRMERALSEMARRGETRASFTFLVDVQDRAIITSAHPIGARTGDIRIERAVVAWLVGARIEPALPPGSGRLIALQISVEAPPAGMD